MKIRDYPVSKSSSHLVFVLTDPLSFDTILQMFSELCTFLYSPDNCLVSPPLIDLSLSHICPGIVRFWAGSCSWSVTSSIHMGSAALTTTEHGNVQIHICGCGLSLEPQTCVLTAYGQNSWISCRFLNLNVSQAKLNILLISTPLRWLAGTLESSFVQSQNCSSSQTGSCWFHYIPCPGNPKKNK